MFSQDKDYPPHKSIHVQPTGRLSHSAVHRQTRQAIRESIELEIDSLIKAPPAAGKSRGVFTAIKNADEPAIYLSPRTDLYDQAGDWCDAEELTWHRLPSMPEDCVSYEANPQVSNAYQRGISPHEIHQRGLCDGGCEYEQRKPPFDSTDDDLGKVPADFADVLIGHPRHAYVPQYVNDRVVIYDDVATQMYLEEYDVCTKNLNAILSHQDCPFRTIEELYDIQDKPERKEDVLDWLGKVDIDYWEDGQTHVKAKQIVKTVLCATLLENGYGYYFGEDFWGVTDGDTNVHLLESPNLRPAQTVLALDAYPMLFTDDAIPMWWITRLGVWLDVFEVLSGKETQEYISDVLGLDVIQTTTAAKPYSSGNNIALQKDPKVISLVSKQEDIETVPVITAKKAKEALEDEVDCGDDVETDWMHFSRVNSNNRFAEKTAGLVLGSPHYGDAYLKLIGAFMGQSISSNGKKGMEKGYGQVGNVILRNMREDMIAQAILRFGRSEEVDDATVYVRTAAIPDYIPVAERPPDGFDSLVNAEAQVKSVFLYGDKASLTTDDVAERVDYSRRQVQNVLDKLEITGEVKRQTDDRQDNPDTWHFGNM